MADVYVRDIVCGEPVEKLYYSAKYPPICVYCAIPVDPNTIIIRSVLIVYEGLTSKTF